MLWLLGFLHGTSEAGVVSGAALERLALRTARSPLAGRCSSEILATFEAVIDRHGTRPSLVSAPALPKGPRMDCFGNLF